MWRVRIADSDFHVKRRISSFSHYILVQKGISLKKNEGNVVKKWHLKYVMFV